VDDIAKLRRLVRFDNFELDLRAGELRRPDAKTVQLSDQPFRILSMLLARPGDVVTRDEIREKLWPNGTVVEFEHSISAAMNRLRQVLGDSPDTPRYIETLARRGYRWRAPVQWVESSAPAAPDIRSSQGNAGGASTLIGKKVSHYRVLEVLGGGGMGVVYKAEDLRLGRRVALKFLPEELASYPDALQRFEREARAASALSHPNICTIYEIEDHESQPFIVMELLEGETLRELIAPALQSSPMPIGRVLDLSIQIAQGLEAAHGEGIVHRDIKPANIFVTTRGQAKILDFGLAKIGDGMPGEALRQTDRASGPDPVIHTSESHGPALQLSRAGVAMGTAGYMSPEQVRGEKLDQRSDLFSFGLVLYEMAAGQRPFSGETASELHEAILHGRPKPARDVNPAIPARLEQIINHALEKDLNQRYQSAGSLLQDLKAVAGGAAAVSDDRVIATHTSVAASGWLNRRFLIAAGLLMLLVVTGVGVRLYLRHLQTSRLTDQDTIILADFTNSTGDPIFDYTVRSGFNIALRQSPFFNILFGGKINSTLRLMGQPANAPLVPAVVTEVCRRLGSKVYITGSIISRGDAYSVAVKVVNCQTGNVIAQERADAKGKENVLDAVGDTAARLRLDLGESQASVRQLNVPLKQAATPSIEAFREYVIGIRALSEKGEAASLPHELRAIELDPNFALAYVLAGQDCANGACPAEKATEYLGRAFELQDHATVSGRYDIEQSYYVFVTGELDKAAASFERELSTYPRDFSALTNLNLVYSELGRYEKAVEMARQAIPLDPSDGRLYANLAHAFLGLQRFDEAKETLKTAVQQKPDNDSNHELLYGLAFLAHDGQAMAEQSAWFKRVPDYEHQAYTLDADTAAYAGRLHQAREQTSRAVDAAKRLDNEVAGTWLNIAALREAAFGNFTQARLAANQALKLAPGAESIELQAALALATAGDAAQAESLAHDLSKRFALDTQVQSLWLPTIEAQLALNKKNPAAAIERLKVAEPVELAFVPFTFNTCLYPAYVRGQANLGAGNGEAAAANFQKILDHSGIVTNCHTGALAHLGLARANALQAQTQQGAGANAARAKSRAAYRDFLALWKNADPDIPILKEAKAEYARLN